MSAAMDHQQRPQPHQQNVRPRSKSTFSFKSQHSASNDDRKNSESSHSRRISDSYKPHLNTTGKADPNAAMNEVQPIAAALEKPTLQSLRSFQHTDKDGNPIAEPDLSNPTRSRWERPLDTIRSFEAAIDNEYRRRAQTVRDSTHDMSGYTSRRSSYYGGSHFEQGRYSQPNGYYGNRPSRDSYYDTHNMGGPVGGPPRTRYNRMQSDPSHVRYPQQQQHHHHQQSNNVYPVNGYQQSRDTVHTNGSGGSHSDPYSNEPSSDNSSVGAPKPDMGEQYGFQGFGGGPILEEQSQNTNQNGMGPAGNGYAVQRPNGTISYNAAPPVPAKQVQQQQQQQGPPVPPHAGKPIKLTKSNTNGNDAPERPSVARQNTEKRKSWFKKRFSKD